MIPRAVLFTLFTLFAGASGCSPSLPSGPVAIAWDDEVCAECRMHVGEPRFAAQLQTRDGEIKNFDDVGCMIRYRDANHPAIHAMWVRNSREDGWIRYEEAAFVDASDSPMGYGLAAVPRGTEGAIGTTEAEARVRERRTP